MTTRRLVNLDDFVTEKTTYNRFGEKVTKTPLVRIADGGLLSNYKQLSTNAKYIKFTGMLEPNDGGEGMYIQDDTITDDEDLGVIIYIGEHKYRRLYAAWVNIDWFYTDDFGVALQRAIKYSSIRGTRGKIYECKTAITLNITARSIGNHGMINHSHKLIDMRNATVNFTNEEAQYCFNIRIYHRDTKFMFTNCNFNVTNNNINLVNIANIIGVNSYTDMLTDNVYNVTKDKLPDTNRVVLVDEPEIEGIKTFDFNGQLQYIGDAISANDNQAVTKAYKPTDYDESLYVSLQDTRKLAGLTTFTSIFDRAQGNTVVQGKINDYILENIQFMLYKILVNTIIPTVSRMYYVNTNTNIYNGILQSYVASYVYKILVDIYITLGDTYIVSEVNIYDPLLLNLTIPPIKITKDNVKSLDESKEIIKYKQYLGRDGEVITLAVSYIYEMTVPLLNNILPPNKQAKDNKFYYIYWEYTSSLYYTGYDNKFYIIPLCDLVTDKCSYIIFTYCGNKYNFDAVINDSYYLGQDITCITISNYIFSEVTYTKQYTKLYNLPFTVNTVSIKGVEYVSNITPVFYIATQDIIALKDGSVDSITVTNIYIEVVNIIQANLVPYTNSSDTKPCVKIGVSLFYNNISINSNYCNIYVARVISLGHPIYEYPSNIAKLLPSVGNNIKYPVFTTHSCNFPGYKHIKYRQSMWIIGAGADHFNYRVHVPCGTDNSGCECPSPGESRKYVSNYYDLTARLSPDQEKNKYTSTVFTFVGSVESRHHAAAWHMQGLEPGMGSNMYSYSDCYHRRHDSNAFNYIYTAFDEFTVTGYNLCIYTNYIRTGSFHNHRYTTTSATWTGYITAGRWCTNNRFCGRSPVLRKTLTLLPTTPMLINLFLGMQDTRDRLFGAQTIGVYNIIRDGNLKDPFRNRTERPEYQFAAPVGVLNP